MYLSGTISKVYQDELFGIINDPNELPDAIKANPKWGISFVFNNLKVLSEIDEIEREINSVLKRLGVSGDSFILKSYSIEELVIGVKHYLIAWSTMKDLMANLVNASLDLGIHENDLSFGMILRNEKVKKSNIPTVCNKHSKTINVSYTDKQRNDAIHRGKLLDDKINEYRSRYSGLFATRYSLLNTDPITDDEFNNGLKELNRELVDLVKVKTEEYTSHFERTLELNKELAIELAQLSAQNLANVRK